MCRGSAIGALISSLVVVVGACLELVMAAEFLHIKSTVDFLIDNER